MKVVVCDNRETMSVNVGLGSDRSTRLPRESWILLGKHEASEIETIGIGTGRRSVILTTVVLVSLCSD